jgi:hypothetical protein
MQRTSKPVAAATAVNHAGWWNGDRWISTGAFASNQVAY